MKYLRVTVRPREAEIHPVHTLMTERDCVRRVRKLHWNLTDESVPSILFYVEGDPDALADAVEEVPEVAGYDITRIGDERFYLHTQGESTEVERELYAAFRRDSLLVLPPLEYVDDGGVSFTVVGYPEDLRAAVDGVPEGVEVDVERVGDYDAEAERVAAALTDRQLEAVTAGLDAGYYDVPRNATHEDVAERLDCAPSTASEHLRKAEARIVSAVFGE